MRPHPLHSYRQVATQTAPPGQLVLMLYDGAITFLNRALAAFQHDDPLDFHQTINNNIVRAQAIINELSLSLDMQQGGELAHHLRRVYNYLDRQLQHGNVTKQSNPIQEALQRLSEIRDSWHQMLNQSAPVPVAADGRA